jgi:Zn ribbon nucleic-acid-binding protein
MKCPVCDNDDIRVIRYDDGDHLVCEVCDHHIRRIAAKELRVELLELADNWQNNPHEGGPDAWHILVNCANDLRAALGEEEGSPG